MPTKKKKKIKIKPENKGKFTRWAKSRGMTVSQATAAVKRNPGKYSPGVRKMATFAANSRRWKK